MLLIERVQAYHKSALPLSTRASKCNKIIYITVVQNHISFEASVNLFRAISEYARVLPCDLQYLNNGNIEMIVQVETYRCVC